MKKLFFASLWVLACLTAACSDEKDEPNGESGSVVGEWVFQKNEYYRNGKMIDSFTAVEDEDKMIAVFREDGTFRYYDFPPEEYYDGTVGDGRRDRKTELPGRNNRFGDEMDL